MSKLLRFFRSIKLAVVLMILIAIVGALGTLVPQYQDTNFYLERYGTLGRVILWLQMDHYSNSVIFATLLVLFFLNTLVCTLWRVVKVWPEIFTLKSRGYQHSILVDLGLDEIEKELREKGFAVVREGNTIFARRGLLSKLSPDLIHLGILFAVVGGLVSGLTLHQEQYFMSPGDSVALNQATVTLLEFEMLTYPDGSPKDWISTVKVEDTLGERIYKVEVNKPADVAGGKLYQWSYMPDWKITLEFPELGYEYSGPAATILEYGGYQIYVYDFIPDFKISNGRVISASEEPLNPAVYLEYYQGDRRVARHWVFAFHEFPADPQDFPVTARLVSYQRSWKTGLMFVESRGDAFILIGLVVISIGSIGLLFPKFVKIFVRETEGGCEAAIAHARKPKQEIEEILRR